MEGADFVFPPHRVEEVPHGPGRVGAVHEAEREAAGPAHGARDEGRMDAAAQFGELHEPALLSAAVEDGHVVVAVEVEHADEAAVPADVRAEGIEAHVQPADAADFSAMTAAWQDAEDQVMRKTSMVRPRAAHMAEKLSVSSEKGTT